MKEIKPAFYQGVTFCGGEPLDPLNVNGFSQIAQMIKKTYPNKTIWCYTGYEWDQIKDLETQISNLLLKTNQVVTTISGIGTILGAIIVSEIGDIHRFDSPSKLVAFAGLDVKVNQSGEFSGTKNKISKRGSPYLRRAIWLAANKAAFCDPVLSDYYQSLKSRGKHHLTAIGAVARKLCNIIFVILRENRPYQIIPPSNQKL